MSTLKPKHTGKSTKPTALNGGAARKTHGGDVLTLSEVAEYLRVSEEDVLNEVHAHGLMGRQIGTEWRFLKSALQRWLEGGGQQSSKEALLNLAGKFKDDPYLEEITQYAYRRRHRSATEEDQ